MFPIIIILCQTNYFLEALFDTISAVNQGVGPGTYLLQHLHHFIMSLINELYLVAKKGLFHIFLQTCQNYIFYIHLML